MPQDLLDSAGFKNRGYDLVLPAAGAFEHVNLENPRKQLRPGKPGSVEHRTLSDTIKEIHVKTGGRLNLKLLELNALRNAVIHCNPQGTSAHAVSFFGNASRKLVRGNVFVLDPLDNETKNMSDIKDQAEVDRQDIFGWFLEFFASELPQELFNAFEKSISELKVLTEFNAVSFGDRKPIFERLVFQGTAPTPKEIVLYEIYFGSPYADRSKSVEEARAFIGDITRLFKL